MPLTHAQRQSLERELPRAVRFDDLTRQLYATDASIYQVEPLAVAFPKSPDDTSKLVRACGEAGVPLISRGAGTGLSGGAIGEGVIADFSRFNRGVSGFDPERRTIHVEAGVVLDQLNAFLKPQGLCFGPDVATSSRATLGGMIANNSSGARAPVYGATIDHVESLDVVLADGRAATIGSGGDTFGDLFERATTLICAREAEVRARLPVGIVKRWPGYGFERWFRNGPGLMQLLGGSEGTLACITGATLRLAPLPQRKSVGVLFFDSVAEAMTATVA
ncbi:MAG: FAD-binding oxidoreductase, partial [Candidatus Hydrogenedentota bacterium]